VPLEPQSADRRQAALCLELDYIPPYDWTHVADFLATRAMPGVERVDDRGYARTVATPDGAMIVSVRPIAGTPALELRVRGTAHADRSSVAAIARRTFDLDRDPAQVAEVLGRDPSLATLVSRRPGLRVVGAWSPFECAVRAVLGQQVSVAAGRTFAARLVERAGEPIPEGDGTLTHLFPSPARLARANLDGLGITGARIGALQALSRALLAGALDFDAPAAELTQRLVALPGFGPWTAQYVAMRALGDGDALPTGDLVLRRMAGNGAVPLTATALAARAEAWRPWRGYATFHLWRAASELR
jgi:AraC family transcriptional regulator, regulatory protein of adaptative response / DNA-3-methyladenine glycosylase II